MGMALELYQQAKAIMPGKGKLDVIVADLKSKLTHTRLPGPGPQEDGDGWSCGICTFINTKPLGLVCEMCSSARS